MAKLTAAARKIFRNRTSSGEKARKYPIPMPLTHEMLWQGARESRSTPLWSPRLSGNSRK